LLNEKDATDGKSVRTTDLPFENFIEFIVQVSHLLFNTYSKIDPVHHPIDFMEGSKNHVTAVNLVRRFWKHSNDFNK